MKIEIYHITFLCIADEIIKIRFFFTDFNSSMKRLTRRVLNLMHTLENNLKRCGSVTIFLHMTGTKLKGYIRLWRSRQFSSWSNFKCRFPSWRENMFQGQLCFKTREMHKTFKLCKHLLTQKVVPTFLQRTYLKYYVPLLVFLPSAFKS